MVVGAACASAADATVTYMFTGIDGGAVEMAVYRTPSFATGPVSVPADQLGWCSVDDSMAAGPLGCSGLQFDSGGQAGDLLTLTRFDGVTQTPSMFLFASGAFGKVGSYRSIGTNMGFLTVSGSSAPEPASWMMLIAGFGLIGLSCRRSSGRLQLTPAHNHKI